MKKIIVALLLIVLSTNALAYASEDVLSSWAIESVNVIKKSEIFDEEFFKNYSSDITRDEFAYLTVKLYEYYTGKSPTIGNEKFIDTKSEWALKAKNLGIVGGYSDGTFRPNNKITRQEIAAMFVNFLKVSGINYKTQDLGDKFLDDKEIASWAKESIYIARENGVIGGVGNNNFNANGNSTKEQALVMVRNIQKSKDTENKKLYSLKLNFYEMIYVNSPAEIPQKFDLSGIFVLEDSNKQSINYKDKVVNQYAEEFVINNQYKKIKYTIEIENLELSSPNVNVNIIAWGLLPTNPQDHVFVNNEGNSGLVTTESKYMYPVKRLKENYKEYLDAADLIEHKMTTVNVMGKIHNVMNLNLKIDTTKYPEISGCMVYGGESIELLSWWNINDKSTIRESSPSIFTVNTDYAPFIYVVFRGADSEIIGFQKIQTNLVIE